MEAEIERLRKALEEGKREIGFLSSRDGKEILTEIDSGEHKPWQYEPKQLRSHYRAAPAPAGRDRLETLLDTDDNMFEMLAANVAEFNKGILDEAKTLRARDESKARWAWWIAAVLYTVGWGLGLLGKIYEVPTVGGEGI